MRLIDADAMIKRLEEWNTNDSMDKALYNFTLCRIIEQPTIEERTIIDGSTLTAYGYNLDEICKFAAACRQEDITETQLHDFVMNMENAVKVAFKEQQEIIERTFLDITKRTGA